MNPPQGVMMDMTAIQAPSDEKRKARLAYVLAGAFAAACLWLNPIGYVGGGADDQHYLAAARCWVANGAPCLPDNHWGARWPVIAPIAGAFALLGDSRASLAVGAGLSWGLAMVAIALLGTRWFGWRAGAGAMVAFAATPLVAIFALTPSPDMTETAFQLAALAAATRAYRRQSVGWAIAGGALAGLAFASRNTSILFLAASAASWFLLDSRRRRVLLWAIAGLALVQLAEMGAYAAATGDPLHRYALALGHTGIASTELPAGFDTSRSPLFNPAYIAAWQREAGLVFFWPIDGWLNVLVSPRLGTLLWTAIFALVLLRAELPRPSRLILVRLGIALAFIVMMLTWGLAVDPKSRMFMNVGAGAALAIGAIIAATAGKKRANLALGLLMAHVLLGLFVIAQLPSSEAAERQAARWIETYGDRIELHEGARTYLAFIPASRSLAPRGSGRDLLIAITGGRCEKLIVEHPVHGVTGRLLDSTGSDASGKGRLCLFEYAADYWKNYPERLTTVNRDSPRTR